jgi:hypothetical protein
VGEFLLKSVYLSEIYFDGGNIYWNVSTDVYAFMQSGKLYCLVYSLFLYLIIRILGEFLILKVAHIMCVCDKKVARLVLHTDQKSGL